MYRFHSETNLIDIIHKFFLFLRSRPLQLSLRILFLHFSLTQTTSNVCVLCRFLRTFCLFFFSQGKIIKTYKRTTWIFVCFCYFSDPVTTCVATWRAKRGFAHEESIIASFRVCQKSVPKVAKFSNFYLLGLCLSVLLDSLNLFWLCTTIVPVIVCVWFVFIPKNGTKSLPP